MLRLSQVSPEKKIHPTIMTVNAMLYDTAVRRGEIVPITVTMLPKRGRKERRGALNINGLMGSDMSGSIGTAVTLAQHTIAEDLGQDLYKQNIFNVSIAGGSKVMYDGFSAGLAIFMAAMGAIVGWESNPQVAVTGEVDSNGLVVRIGNVLDKIEAAIASNVTKVFIPKDNLQDVINAGRLPVHWSTLQIFAVSHVRDMLAITEGEEDEIKSRQ